MSKGSRPASGRFGSILQRHSPSSSLARVASTDARTTVEPARVFLKLEGIRGTSDAAIYHVYIDLPPNADPAEYADRLAGTISLFDLGRKRS